MENLSYFTIILFTIGGLALGAGLFLVYYFFATATREARRPTRLTLLSANLGNVSVKGFFSGFKLDDEKIPVLRDNIEELDPDILHLQEMAGPDQVEKIIDREKYMWYFEDESCTAVRRGLFTHLDAMPEYMASEGFTGCTAYLEPEKSNLSLINVHTAAPIKDNLFSKRGAQIQFLLNEISRLHTEGKNLIVAGDFNFDPYRFESFRHKILDTGTKSELDHTRDKWNEILSDDSPLHLVSPDDHTWHLTLSYTIDHIITNITCTDCSVLNTDGTRIDLNRNPTKIIPQNFLDHRALFCRLKFHGGNKSALGIIMKRFAVFFSRLKRTEKLS